MMTWRATLRSPQTLAALAIATVGVFWLAQGRLLRGGALVVVAVALLAVARMPSRKYAMFALITATLAAMLPLTAAAGLDLYLHSRYATTGGYNVWGYRGAAIGAKAPGERRITVLGGSAAFGYGVRTNEAFPAYLEQTLDASERQAGRGAVRVVNLAWNGEGAYAFRSTIDDYDYLQPDLVLLYSGYNDLAENTQNFRAQSPIFRATGYMPMLHVLPINGWLRVGDLSETRQQDRVVFQPNLADRSATRAADVALQITKAVERQMDRLAGENDLRETPRTGASCGRWEHYCQWMQLAIQAALDRGRHVVIVTEPFVGGGGHRGSGHINQQSTLLAWLAARFAGEPRLHYVNMGHAVDLTDTALCYDGLHLTPKGNQQLATRLGGALGPVLESLDRALPATPLQLMPPRPDVDALASYGRLRAARARVATAASEARVRLAIAEWAAGDVAQAAATIKTALDDRHSSLETLWGSAMVVGLTGDAAGATALAARFEKVAPASTYVERLWMPVLRAAIDLGAARDEDALRQLERTLPFERDSYWPRYLRGLIRLKQQRGFEAEEEFLRILSQPELNVHDPLYVTSRRHLASARVLEGAAKLYGDTYQAFFLAWKQADRGLPLLERAIAEYLDLRQSIGMPPLPF